MKGEAQFTTTKYAAEHGVTITDGKISLRDNFICPINYDAANYLSCSGTIEGVTSAYAAVYVNHSAEPYYETNRSAEYTITSGKLSIFSFSMYGYDFNYGSNTVTVRIFDSKTNELLAEASLDVLMSYYNLCYSYYLTGMPSGHTLRRYDYMQAVCPLINAPLSWNEQTAYQKANNGSSYPYDGVIIELPTANPKKIASFFALPVHVVNAKSDHEGPVRLIAMPYWTTKSSAGIKQFDMDANCKKATMPVTAGNRSAEYLIPDGESYFTINLTAAYMRNNPPDGVVISLAPGETGHAEIVPDFPKAQQDFADFCIQPAPVIQPFAVFLDWSWFTPPDPAYFDRYEVYKDGELLVTFNSPSVTRHTDYEVNVNEEHDYFILAFMKPFPDENVVFPETVDSPNAEITENVLQPKFKQFDTKPSINTSAPNEIKVDRENETVTMQPNTVVKGYSRVYHKWSLLGHFYPPTALVINLESGSKSAEYDITYKMGTDPEELTGFKQKTFTINTSNGNFGGLRFE